ncbi:hypothetical protein C5F64_18760 [Photobacterium damselae subsp. damselae]|nr:hypothetical protein C5F64_18760 [Photobacterium damselae subsp. damselae]
MNLILKISVVNSGEIEVYEAPINAHLTSIFGQDSTVNFNHEFVCAVHIEFSLNSLLILTFLIVFSIQNQHIYSTFASANNQSRNIWGLASSVDPGLYTT